jgi:hypothetical protein
MNLNDFAKRITEREGLKKSLSIAQVKEVLKIVLQEFKKIPLKELVTMIKRQK